MRTTRLNNGYSVALSERFAGAMGTMLSVQAATITGITTINIDGLKIFPTNFNSERIGSLHLTIDGDQYLISFKFTDETLDGRNLRGKQKKRDPNAAGLI